MGTPYQETTEHNKRKIADPKIMVLEGVKSLLSCRPERSSPQANGTAGFMRTIPPSAGVSKLVKKTNSNRWRVFFIQVKRADG